MFCIIVARKFFHYFFSCFSGQPQLILVEKLMKIYPSKNHVKNCPNYQQALIHILEVFLQGPNLSTLYSNIV